MQKPSSIASACKNPTLGKNCITNGFYGMISAESDEILTPHFAMKPTDMVVSEGASVLLHCAAYGRDRSGALPKVVWLRDGSTVDLPYVHVGHRFSLFF